MFDAGFQKPSFDGKGNTNVVLFCFLFFSYIMKTQDPFLAGSSFVYSTMKVLYEIWRMPLGPPILGNSQSYLDQLNRSSSAWYICMIRRISFNVSFTGLGLPHHPRLGPLVDVIKLFLEEI